MQSYCVTDEIDLADIAPPGAQAAVQEALHRLAKVALRTISRTERKPVLICVEKTAHRRGDETLLTLSVDTKIAYELPVGDGLEWRWLPCVTEPEPPT